MQLIEQWWTVVRQSYAVWLGQLIGWMSAWQALLTSMSPEDQITLHAAAQIHWIPFIIAVLGIFGIGAARAVKQPNFPTK